MSRISRLTVAGLLSALIPLVAGTQSAGATVFRVTTCTYSKADAAQYNIFRQNWIRILYPDGRALVQAVDPVIRNLAAAANSGANKALTIARGKSALAAIPAVSRALDRIGMDHAAMKRALNAGAFDHVKNAVATAELALTALDGRLKQLFTSVQTMKSSATAFSSGDKEGGTKLYDQAMEQFAEADSGYFTGVARDIAQAAQELAEGCNKTVLTTPAMSSSQISNAAGGGGSQRAGKGGFVVLAPKQLRLSKHDKQGRITLSLTITTSTYGDIEISLSSGNKLIIDLHGSTGSTAHGKFGVRVVLPRKTHTGKARLSITFIPAGQLTAPAIRLPIRLT